MVLAKFLGLLAIITALLLTGCGSTVYITMGCGATFTAKAVMYGSMNISTSECGATTTTTSSSSSVYTQGAPE